jgi:hypothetical protein
MTHVIKNIFSGTLNLLTVGVVLAYLLYAYSACPEWQMFEFYHSETEARLDPRDLKGVWKLVDSTVGADLVELGEPEYFAVYLQETDILPSSDLLIEVGEYWLSLEELQELLMTDI